MGGSARRDIIRPATTKDLPNALPELSTADESGMNSGFVKTASPNRAKTIAGTPKRTSIALSTVCASHAGRRYSVRNTAVPTPIGSAIRQPIAVRTIVPTRGPLTPPVTPSSAEPGAGSFQMKSQERAEAPLTASQTTIELIAAIRMTPDVQ